MSILHPSPGRREIKNPFIGLSPPSSTSFNCHFLFWIWTLDLLFYGLVGLGFSLFPFSFFRLCVRVRWSDLIFDTNTVLDALVTSSKWGGVGVIAALGKVLYNNGLIFLFREDLPPHVCFFLFAPFLITCCRWLILHSCRLCCKSVSSSKLKIIA